MEQLINLSQACLIDNISKAYEKSWEEKIECRAILKEKTFGVFIS